MLDLVSRLFLILSNSLVVERPVWDPIACPHRFQCCPSLALAWLLMHLERILRRGIGLERPMLVDIGIVENFLLGEWVWWWRTC